MRLNKVQYKLSPSAVMSGAACAMQRLEISQKKSTIFA
jgi:hypothetical protein